jgi:hypothetical protein
MFIELAILGVRYIPVSISPANVTLGDPAVPSGTMHCVDATVNAELVSEA